MATSKHLAPQREPRTSIAVAVRISGHPRVPGIEIAFTENVSLSGARVVSRRHWQPNEQIAMASLSGDFCTMARVIYCQTRCEEGFAVGLEFLEPVGGWLLGPSPESGNNAHA